MIYVTHMIFLYMLIVTITQLKEIEVVLFIALMLSRM